MFFSKKKINNILDYILIFILFLLALNKGGYYKQDSIIFVYIIQIISAFFYMLNVKDAKKNSVMNLFLLIFSISYFIPVLFNASSVSGALNIASRIYTFYLIYCLVNNSQSKKLYLKSLLVFTVIFSILGIDEIGDRILNFPLSLIGGGYVVDKVDKISSIFQYSNLLGILCVIFIVYIQNKLLNNNYNKYKYSFFKTIVGFLGITMFLIQSKMVLLLYIISCIYIYIYNKKYSGILEFIISTIYYCIVSTLVFKYNVYIVIALAIIISYIYNLITKLKILEKYNSVIKIFTILLFIIIILFNWELIIRNGIISRINEYFNNFDSSKLRLTYYIDALKIVIKSPLNLICGIGGNGFRTVYETVQNSNYISLEVHSLFIQILVESGLIGLICILIPIMYVLIKAKNNINKLMLIILLIFSCFDVYLTYTFMLFVLAILMASCDIKLEAEDKKNKILNIIIFIFIFIINTSHILAFFIKPYEINNINNSLEEQEKIINKCKLALILDPYDLGYMQDYNIACKTYLNIMDIKKSIYGVDDIQKRNYIVNNIYNNLNNEIKYEKSNKYVIEDISYYILKYIDQLVIANFSDNIKAGYEYYFQFILQNLEKLKLEHSYNEMAMEIYSNANNEIYDKFSNINTLINSEKIGDILESIKENIDISL